VNNLIIGRVTKFNGTIGQAEFKSPLKVGDLIYYKTSTKQKIMCQVNHLQSLPYSGFTGKFTILDNVTEVPKLWDYLYLMHQPITGHLRIGTTDKGEVVKLRVNPFFRHVLVGGKTGRGKTHLQLVLEEEFLKHNIPSIVIDTQGEFVNINKFNANATVVEDIRLEDLLSYLKFKKTVVYNLQGLSHDSKAQRCLEVLSQLKEAKEKDYKQAENNVKLLKIPPVIINIDEAELYAPETYRETLNVKCRECVINIAKRGGKMGIGLVVGTQRMPGLHRDVRSQCNSAIVFQITDSGSQNVLLRQPHITSYEVKRVKNLFLGHCLVTGLITPHPIRVLVRDIKTQRAKNTDFEKMLGLEQTFEQMSEQTDSEEEIRKFEETLKQGVTFEKLKAQFPTRQVPIHGECIVIPERHFKTDWKNTLEIQGCKVVHCPDLPGGSCYFVRKQPIKKMLRP